MRNPEVVDQQAIDRSFEEIENTTQQQILEQIALMHAMREARLNELNDAVSTEVPDDLYEA